MSTTMMPISAIPVTIRNVIAMGVKVMFYRKRHLAYIVTVFNEAFSVLVKVHVR